MNRRFHARFCIVLFTITFCALGSASAQTTSYKQTNLVSDVPGMAANLDHRLITPWGIALSPDQPFRVANNGNGSFTSYDATGANQVFQGNVAAHAGATLPSRPTGVVFNPITTFAPRGSLASPFLFATEDGTISGEYTDSQGDILQATILAVDNSAHGAVYTGLAIATPDCCAPYLAVANFNAGFIETYTSFFDPLATPGNFTDPNLPAGYAPYNLQVIGNQIFVTYALQDAAKHSAVTGTGLGIVNIFDLEGNFVKRFASNGPLDAPWGVVKASAHFGAFSNDILIGNFGGGIINAFDPATGNFVGTLNDAAGNPIIDLGLHGMAFGVGNTGDPDTLYITASLSGGNLGVLGAISVDTTPPPDFSVTTLAGNSAITANQAANFTFTVTPTSGFQGNVDFSCTAPAGITCSFNPASVSTVGGAVNTALTVTASANMAQRALPGGMGSSGFLFAGLGLFGVGLSLRIRRPGGAGLLSLAAALMLITGACVGCSAGYNTTASVMPPATTGPTATSNPPATPAPPPTPRTVSIQVTAQSGAISHSTLLSLTVQ